MDRPILDSRRSLRVARREDEGLRQPSRETMGNKIQKHSIQDARLCKNHRIHTLFNTINTMVWNNPFSNWLLTTWLKLPRRWQCSPTTRLSSCRNAEFFSCRFLMSRCHHRVPLSFITTVSLCEKTNASDTPTISRKMYYSIKLYIDSPKSAVISLIERGARYLNVRLHCHAGSSLDSYLLDRDLASFEFYNLVIS